MTELGATNFDKLCHKLFLPEITAWIFSAEIQVCAAVVAVTNWLHTTAKPDCIWCSADIV